MPRIFLSLLLAAVLTTPAQAEVLWQDGAERLPYTAEWAKHSCENESRFAAVTDPPPDSGQRSWRISVQDGDDSFGERCELALGNAGSSDIERVGGYNVLFHRNQAVYITGAIWIPRNQFTFGCGQSGVRGCDGGLVWQLKQLGSCGVPAMGLLADAPDFHYRISGGSACGSDNNLYTAFRWPIQYDRWVRIMLRVGFSPSSVCCAGFVKVWVDDDGDREWTPRAIVPQPGPAWSVSLNRIYGHTQKEPTDHPAACPARDVCSHFRVGVYRDPDVTGASTIYHDSHAFAKDRAEAEAAVDWTQPPTTALTAALEEPHESTIRDQGDDAE